MLKIMKSFHINKPAKKRWVLGPILVFLGLKSHLISFLTLIFFSSLNHFTYVPNHMLVSVPKVSLNIHES